METNHKNNVPSSQQLNSNDCPKTEFSTPESTSRNENAIDEVIYINIYLRIKQQKNIYRKANCRICIIQIGMAHFHFRWKKENSKAIEKRFD